MNKSVVANAWKIKVITDLKVCPVCRTLEVSENIGPALFFSNLVPEIQALERCWFPNPKDEEEVVKNEDTEEEKEVDREEVVEEEEKEEVEEEAKHEDKTEDKEDGKENKVILTSTSTLQNDTVYNGNSAADEEHTLKKKFYENKMEQKSSPIYDILLVLISILSMTPQMSMLQINLYLYPYPYLLPLPVLMYRIQYQNFPGRESNISLAIQSSSACRW